jgi:hypothetical protein
MAIIIGSAFLLILSIGLFSFIKRLLTYKSDLNFAFEYRNRFVSFANTFLKEGTIENEEYVWLTKFVTRIQTDLGQFGIMDFIAPFNRYHIPQYQNY